MAGFFIDDVSKMGAKNELVAKIQQPHGPIFKVKQCLPRKLKHICAACKESFAFNCLLKYHIRRHHFNLVGTKPTYADTQNVNDEWTEKVANTNFFVKIKKIGENALLIQKLEDGFTVADKETKEAKTDLRKQYPISSAPYVERIIVECRECQKSFGRRKLAKHFAACHAHLISKRCDACNINFKRIYNCARHICPNSSIKNWNAKLLNAENAKVQKTEENK